MTEPECDGLFDNIVAVYRSDPGGRAAEWACNGILLRDEAIAAPASAAPDYGYVVKWQGFELAVSRVTSYPDLPPGHVGEAAYPAIAVYRLQAPTHADVLSWWSCKAGDRVRIAGLRPEYDGRLLPPRVVEEVRPATVLGKRGPWWELHVDDPVGDPPQLGAAVFDKEHPYFIGMVASVGDWWTKRSVRVVSVRAVGHTVDAAVDEDSD
ncbi:hypothetical protein ACF9IK_35105 [Kitasatospora hibisci]|uniref:hypothetical protein n=1 Tax=Kitasatospora hibisci TaxID=3369522 RepID=UPI0037544705